MTCHYCTARAIGHERIQGTPCNVNVCRACAHPNVTVYLRAGGTWVKRARGDDRRHSSELVKNP